MAIVDEILEGKKDVIIGTREIRYNAIESYGFFSESKQYVYDSIGFETAYGLFDTIDELSNVLTNFGKLISIFMYTQPGVL